VVQGMHGELRNFSVRCVNGERGYCLPLAYQRTLTRWL
jgi:hypothetical protein